MTWQNFIYKCGRQIGKPEKWAEASGGVATTDLHIDRAYAALMAVLSAMPYSRLSAGSIMVSEDVPVVDNGYYVASLPQTVLSSREDLGIDHVSVSGSVVYPEKFIPLTSFLNIHDNLYQAGNLLVASSQAAKKIYINKAKVITDIQLNYYKLPVKATLADLTVPWPLNDYDSEAAIQIVAAHAAIDSQDSELFKAHSILANFYEGEK